MCPHSSECRRRYLCSRVPTFRRVGPSGSSNRYAGGSVLVGLPIFEPYSYIKYRLSTVLSHSAQFLTHALRTSGQYGSSVSDHHLSPYRHHHVC